MLSGTAKVVMAGGKSWWRAEDRPRCPISASRCGKKEKAGRYSHRLGDAAVRAHKHRGKWMVMINSWVATVSEACALGTGLWSGERRLGSASSRGTIERHGDRQIDANTGTSRASKIETRSQGQDLTLSLRVHKSTVTMRMCTIITWSF